MRTILALTLALALALAGCGQHGALGTGGSTTSNPCIENPASCMGTCTGQCAPNAAGFPEWMVQVWTGPVGSTPPGCLPEAPVQSTGYIDSPPDSLTCSPPCICGSSQDSCYLPGTFFANTAACPGQGNTNVLDTPAEWNGTCFPQTPTLSGDSFTVAASELSATGGMCEPSGAVASNVQGGKTIAQPCVSTNNPPIPVGNCPNNEVCAYQRVDGFLLCLLDQFGDVPCPVGWPNKHLYYDNSVLCSCSCGAPMGESCTTTVTVYADTACQQPLRSAAVSADPPNADYCIDVPPGSTFGSISAKPPAFVAGTCTPMLTKTPPWTLCCLP